MNVSLTARLEKFIAQKVKSGRYQTASEVVRQGLRLLEERDRKLASLKGEVQKGIDDLDAGRFIDVDEAGLHAFMERIKREGRRRIAKARRKKAG